MSSASGLSRLLKIAVQLVVLVGAVAAVREILLRRNISRYRANETN